MDTESYIWQDAARLLLLADKEMTAHDIFRFAHIATQRLNVKYGNHPLADGLSRALLDHVVSQWEARQPITAAG